MDFIYIWSVSILSNIPEASSLIRTLADPEIGPLLPTTLPLKGATKLRENSYNIQRRLSHLMIKLELGI